MQYESLMQYKSPVPQHGILNLTPLIDIVFLLLVFFMLTAHFVEEKQIALQLPTAASSEALSSEEVVTVSIDQAGMYYLSGEPIHADVLQSRLTQLFTQFPKLILQLKADQQVSYEKVVHVLDSARIVGIDNMDIVTESE